MSRVIDFLLYSSLSCGLNSSFVPLNQRKRDRKNKSSCYYHEISFIFRKLQFSSLYSSHFELSQLADFDIYKRKYTKLTIVFLVFLAFNKDSY